MSERQEPSSAYALSAPDGKFFDRASTGRLRATSPRARDELEAFAAKLRSIVGARAAQVNVLPYRHGRSTLWTFAVEGCDHPVLLTFVQGGRTCLPHNFLHSGAGQVADAVDAFYLFEFLKRELSDVVESP